MKGTLSTRNIKFGMVGNVKLGSVVVRRLVKAILKPSTKEEEG